jgi:plastocyanin
MSLPSPSSGRPLHARRGSRRRRHAAVGLAVAFALGACDSGGPTVTPLPVPGTVVHPREVNIIAREYAFAPAVVDLIPGETVLIHLVNAGLETHEAVIGDAATQAAWETAEAATAGAPPGPTPLVSVPPAVAGLRLVARSGQRVDMTWTVPVDGPPLIVGCHIPGHWAQGMQVPVAFATPSP